jgi:hypothetical protein
MDTTSPMQASMAKGTEGTEGQRMEGTMSWLSDGRNWIIVVLLAIMVFSALGGPLLKPLMDGFQQLLESLTSFIRNIIGSLSYSSGQILESGAETVKTVGGATLSVGTDVLDDMADLLKGQPGTDKIAPITEPRPTPPENPVQGTQTQWCLVGEYQGQRSCLETTDNEKCLSGQLFTDRNKCINPALTKQM